DHRTVQASRLQPAAPIGGGPERDSQSESGGQRGEDFGFWILDFGLGTLGWRVGFRVEISLVQHDPALKLASSDFPVARLWPRHCLIQNPKSKIQNPKSRGFRQEFLQMPQDSFGGSGLAFDQPLCRLAHPA